MIDIHDSSAPVAVQALPRRKLFASQPEPCSAAVTTSLCCLP